MIQRILNKIKRTLGGGDASRGAVAPGGEPEMFEYRGYSIPVPLVNITGGGPETFDVISKGHMVQLEKYTPLEADHSIVEIGCGIGRDAIPLTEVLSGEGRYLGVDIIKGSIDWCTANITPKFPNFTFVHYDVGDQLHNPGGAQECSEVALPVEDGSVDRIIVQSVFTHVFEEDVVHYFREFARILGPEGLALSSFFIYDEEVLASARKLEGNPLRFEHHFAEGVLINDPLHPGGAVAYTRAVLDRMLEAGGLELVAHHPGAWSGHTPDLTDGQDMLVLRRKR